MTRGLKELGQTADVHTKVRATRAYLAGFGTSGSLLVGAALIFVLASAVVAFHGWPQVATQPPAVNVSVSQVRTASSSRASRALRAALGAHRVLLAGRAAVGAGVNRGGGARGTGSNGGGSNAARGSTSTGTPGTTVIGNARCSSGCGSSLPSGPVNTVTGAVGEAISAAGAGAGSLVSGVSSSAANALKGVSPTAAGTVNTTGQSLGTTVTGVGKHVGGSVSRLTGGFAHR